MGLFVCAGWNNAYRQWLIYPGSYALRLCAFHVSKSMAPDALLRHLLCGACRIAVCDWILGTLHESLFRISCADVLDVLSGAFGFLGSDYYTAGGDIRVSELLRVLQTADQLSVSATVRGAERPGRRSSYFGEPLRMGDWLMAVFWTAAAAGFLAIGGVR